MHRILAIVLLLFPAYAHAQLSITDRQSRVTASETFAPLLGGMSTDTSTLETTNLLLFSQTVSEGQATASQTSSVSPLLFQHTSSVDGGMAGSEFGSTSASSLFRVEFDITNPSSFELTGLLTEDDVLEEAGIVSLGGTTVSLIGTGLNLSIDSDFANDVTINESGVLNAGSYVLEVLSSGGGSTIEPSAITTTDFTFSVVSVVPEPSSIVVFGCGLMCLLSGRRRTIG